MSNVRTEIEQHSEPADKPILLWLLDHYRWASEWQIMAGCTFKRYGTDSFPSHRVWAPSKIGRSLYAADAITAILDGGEWNADTLDAIADTLRAASYKIG